MKYSAVLFDFNGVILWDAEWHQQAWDALATKLIGRPLSKEESARHMHGKTTGETISFLLGGKKGNKAKLLKEKEKMYQAIALSNKGFRLSPGAEKLFTLLEKNGIKKTIATSSPLMNIRFYYSRLNLERWFPRKNIVFDTGRLPSKPAPDIYLRAAKKINVDVKKCIVIEDAISGIESARRASAGKIIALAHGHNSAYLKKIPHVGRIVENLGQITLRDFD